MNEEEKMPIDEAVNEEEELNEAPREPETEQAPEKPETEQTPENKTSKPMSRKRKHGIISLITTVIVVAAVVLVNIIASAISSKNYGLTADLTKLRSFELTETTQGVMSRLDKKVTISFMSDRSSYISLDSYCKQTVFIAEEMAKCSKGTLSVEYVDLVRNPSYADDFDRNELNTTDIIVSCGENKQILTVSDIFNFEDYSGSYKYIVSSSAERKLNNAVLAVSNDMVIKAVLLTDNTDADYSYFKRMLTYNGYDVSETALNKEDIPADADMAVLFAPSADYSEDAVRRLESFLYNGGKYGKTLLFAANPTDVSTPNLDSFLEKYNIYFGMGYAYDTGEKIFMNDSLTGVSASQAESTIPVIDIDDSKPVIIPIKTRPVGFDSDEGTSPLLVYSEKSGMVPFSAGEDWDPEGSVVGNVCVLGMADVGSEEKSYILAAGSYTMFDRSFAVPETSDKLYYTYVLDWVNDREIERADDIPDKVISKYDIDIDKQTAVNLGFIVYALIPLLILGTGFTVYLMRKNR